MSWQLEKLENQCKNKHENNCRVGDAFPRKRDGGMRASFHPIPRNTIHYLQTDLPLPPHKIVVGVGWRWSVVGVGVGHQRESYEIQRESLVNPLILIGLLKEII